MPVLRLARLAVALAHQGHGIGRLLLRDVLQEALALRDRHACLGVVVDAKPEAVGYYAAFGFRRVEVVAGQIQGETGATLQMFLPVKTIELALGSDGPGGGDAR